MGYDTTYRLHWPEDSPTMEEVCQLIAGTNYWKGNRQMVHDVLEGQPTGWHHWADDLARAAAQWPGVTFTLEGHGDDYEDIWRAFFRGDQWYQEHASFPEPDEDRLNGRWQGDRPTATEIHALVRAEGDLADAIGELAGAYRRGTDLNRAAEQSRRARRHREGSLERIAHFCATGRYSPTPEGEDPQEGHWGTEDLNSLANATRQAAALLDRQAAASPR